MSDMALKSTGQGEVLPEADAFIIDEAHQLPSVASQFLGFRLSSHQIQELARDCIKEMNADASDMLAIQTLAEKVESQLHQLKLKMDGRELRIPLDEFYQNFPKFKSQLNELNEVINDLSECLEEAEARSRGLSLCKERTDAISEKITEFMQLEAPDLVFWIETKHNQFVLQATPQEVGDIFQTWLEQKHSSWVFASATITVAGKFKNFNQRLGLIDPIEGMWPSPFDYAKQSLLYMPSIPVDPSHADYNSHVADIARSVIKHSKGRTFLLFTSYKAMYEVADQITDLPYPVLVQRSQGKHQLLAEFKAHGDAVLLGTSSFWEGVDVRGEALSCVLIDKIPFSAPDDPVLQARMNFLKTHGGNPFQTIQIPDAVIQLKQGIGRLLRDEKDRGLLVLCDPRLLNKPYGKQFLRSLPAMPITQSIDDVADFFGH
jgi:ATP-dependent DNA helicase DinG